MVAAVPAVMELEEQPATVGQQAVTRPRIVAAVVRMAMGLVILAEQAALASSLFDTHQMQLHLQLQFLFLQLI